VCASDKRYMSPAVMKLLVVLRRSAFSGSSPTWITARAITLSRNGETVEMASAGPATATRSWPAWATGVEPKTGAARYVAPCGLSKEDMEADVLGCTVVVSTKILLVKEPHVIMVSMRVLRTSSSLTFANVRT